MKKILFIIIFVFFWFSTVKSAEISCPVFKEPLVSGSEILGKIEECKTARKNNNTASITDFACPAGEFAIEDSSPLSDQRIAYHIAVNILMNKADEETKKFMQELQKQRSKDAVSWAKKITSCIDGSPEIQTKSVSELYSQICDFWYIEKLLNSASDKVIIGNTDAYPHTFCTNLSNQKIQAWKNLGKSLAVAGINKSFQNDKDSFIDKVHWQYRGLIEKFHTYQKIIFRASSKIDKFIRNPVTK